MFGSIVRGSFAFDSLSLQLLSFSPEQTWRRKDMAQIQTLYVVNHSHTDIGFTDYQDLCFQQHAEFIEQVLNLCEATEDYPPEARYRWVCEVTGTTERYLRNATSSQRERFRFWHERGAIDVAGMQYNLTPLLNIEQIHRSLYPVRRLREEYGLNIDVAMQSDVNGISWLFADLLPAIGINFLTMSVNPMRGAVPKPVPAAFWWEGPSGNRILVWNGYHYLFGRSIVKLGDWRFAEQSLPRAIEKLEKDPDYPYDFLYCQSTHPMRVDNGPPDQRMSDFVRDWNAAGRTPRIVLTTPREFGQQLLSEHGANLPTMRGDWTDWWSDGVASSAYETGISRATHELLAAAEMIAAWMRAQGETLWPAKHAAWIYEQATLYDEHTWGAFASIERPQTLWTKAQWNRKASFAYNASSQAHDLLARGAQALAHRVAEPGPEGRFNLGDLTPEEAYPKANIDELLVINTLPWTRKVLIEEPELRCGAAPVGVLDCFFPRDVSWGGARPQTPTKRIEGEVPGFGYAFLPLNATPLAEDIKGATNVIENAHYRIVIDPDTGSVAEWLDKDLNHDFAGTYEGWGIGQYIYEWVDSPKQREALFYADFSDENFGYGITDTPFRREVASKVQVHAPNIDQERVSITVEIEAPGVRRSSCTYSLHTHEKVLYIDWLLDKEHITDVEAVFIAFPFALDRDRIKFRADVNGIPLSPNEDQLPGTVRDWYPIQRWVDISDGNKGVTIAPLDAPLVHLGGITTGRWAEQLELEGPYIMSWALNNHWPVNFKASQGGEIPLRYRLTTHDRDCSDLVASKFGAEAMTSPIVLRDYRRTDTSSDCLFKIPKDASIFLTAKPAEDGDGVIVRLQNLDKEPQTIPLNFTTIRPRSVCYTSPVEIDEDKLDLKDGIVSVTLAASTIKSLRLRY